MIIAPIIFCTVVVGIAGMEDMKKVGKTGGLALLYFEIVSSIALVVGLVIINIVRPGAGMNVDVSQLDTKSIAAYTGPGKMQSTTDFVLNIIPNTLVDAFAKGEILQVLLIAVMFGFALHRFGGRGTLVFDVIEKGSHVLFVIVGYIMKVAPIGAFGAMAFTIGKYGVSSLLQLGQLMATFYITCLLFIFVVLGGIARFHGFSIWKFIKYIKEELLIVLGTSSSESVLPRMMAKLENLGAKKSVVGLVVPTGYSFNLDGTSIYLTMAAVFIAQATNTDMTLTQQLTLLAVLLLTSKGAAGVTACAGGGARAHPGHRPLHVGGPRAHQPDRQRRGHPRGRQVDRRSGHRAHAPAPEPGKRGGSGRARARARRHRDAHARRFGALSAGAGAPEAAFHLLHHPAGSNRMSEKQRVVLVTGGMGGLGETISTKMVDAGYKLAVTYSPGNKSHADWVAQMAERGYRILAVPCDVADYDACAQAVSQVQEALGPVDVLVNNAGITRDMTFRKMDQINWNAVLRTNLDSLFNMSKQVADGMVERGWGRIINVSSVNGSKGAFGQTNYSAAKAGVHGFTKALALEVARKGVTVNTISPGYIGTKMVTAIPKEVLDSKILPHIPVGRLGRPEEVAGLIIYLASQEAAFVTGANIAINGGQHMQ